MSFFPNNINKELLTSTTPDSRRRLHVSSKTFQSLVSGFWWICGLDSTALTRLAPAKQLSNENIPLEPSPKTNTSKLKVQSQRILEETITNILLDLADRIHNPTDY